MYYLSLLLSKAPFISEQFIYFWRALSNQTVPYQALQCVYRPMKNQQKKPRMLQRVQLHVHCLQAYENVLLFVTSGVGVIFSSWRTIFQICICWLKIQNKPYPNTQYNFPNSKYSISKVDEPCFVTRKFFANLRPCVLSFQSFPMYCPDFPFENVKF